MVEREHPRLFLGGTQQLIKCEYSLDICFIPMLRDTVPALQQRRQHKREQKITQASPDVTKRSSQIQNTAKKLTLFFALRSPPGCLQQELKGNLHKS